MDNTRLPTTAIAWLALIAAPVTTWWLATRTWSWGHEISWTPSTLDEAVLLLAGVLGAGVAAYLSLSTVAILVTTASPEPSRSWARRLTPEVWRRVVATALSAGLATGVATPALAADSGADPVDTSPAHAGWVDAPADAAVTTSQVAPTPTASPSPSTSPAPSVPLGDTNTAPAAAVPTEAGDSAPASWPTSGDQVPAADTDSGAVADTGSGSGAEEAATYTVDKGDSLWRITANLLGGDADDGEIAQQWPVLYRANKDVIGDNPALIHPGQELTIPQELAS